MANLSHITRCGRSGIDGVPSGMHACHFYSNRDRLVAALVPYSVAGLRSNERCLWATAPALSTREAVQALRAARDGVDDAIQAGALRFLDVTLCSYPLGQCNDQQMSEVMHAHHRALERLDAD